MTRVPIGGAAFVIMAAIMVLASASPALSGGRERDTEFVTPIASKRDAAIIFTASNGETREAMRSASANGSSSTRPASGKNYTLYRFNPKYGDLAVQTIFGRVNGAQLQLNW